MLGLPQRETRLPGCDDNAFGGRMVWRSSAHEGISIGVWMGARTGAVRLESGVDSSMGVVPTMLERRPGSLVRDARTVLD